MAPGLANAQPAWQVFGGEGKGSFRRERKDSLCLPFQTPATQANVSFVLSSKGTLVCHSSFSVQSLTEHLRLSCTRLLLIHHSTFHCHEHTGNSLVTYTNASRVKAFGRLLSPTQFNQKWVLRSFESMKKNQNMSQESLIKISRKQ